jgi:O-antigen/teichoic acid export membrane protein
MDRVSEIQQEVRSFGWRAMPGNIMADVNSRVDVLMLGLLTNRMQTGLYSLPGMLLDGLFHFTVVLRTIVNGKMGRAQSQGDVNTLRKLFKIGVLMSFGITVPMAVVVYFAFPLIIRYGGLDQSFIAGREPFLTLMILFCMASGFLPFVMAPNQFGMPVRQTSFFAIVFGSNVVGNLILIPLWGINGAALATGISFLVYGGLVVGFFNKFVFREKK